MTKRPANIILSLALLTLAAAGLLLLGLRSGLGERAAALENARIRLRAMAGESARELINAAHRLAQVARAGGLGTALFREGRFVEPAEPVELGSLRTIRGRDHMGDWLLEQAGRAEFDPRAEDDPEGLYQSAAADGNDAQVRKLALFRLAALCRREGRGAEADVLNRQFLLLLTTDECRTTREGLIARTLSHPLDDRLEADLLNCLGGADESIAVGLLEQAGLSCPDAIRERRRELRLLHQVRPLRPGPDDRAGSVVLRQGILLVRERLQDGSHRLTAGPAPELGADQFLLAANQPVPQKPDRLFEVVDLGDSFPGLRIATATSRVEVERSADARSLLIWGALLLLLVGLGLAVFQTLRAARRESAAAAVQSAFMAQVGHDLRTPLTLIRMYAETLASGKVNDPAQAREFAGIAAREAKRLSRMVGTVLELSRTRANEFQSIDLSALLQELAEAHRPLLEEHGLIFELNLPGNGPFVAGDRDALQNVFGNLLENALRHAAGGGRVRLSLQEQPGQVIVELLDRGPGFPVGLEHRLFERFVRGPDQPGRGAGLGLALVKEVVERHGGSVSAANREGGGARFVLNLPITDPVEEGT